MKQLTIDVIAGARPNFMKISALFTCATDYPHLQLRLIHTGQHYDSFMSDIFFQQLGLPKPTVHLEVGSGTHAYQTGEIMKKYEEWIAGQKPDLCLVVGDVNSTIACALVAAKAGIPVGHVEAGLRSFDRNMPEEINRILTDSISNILFVSESSGVTNLKKEGHRDNNIFLVGNVMIDTLLRMKPQAENLKIHKHYALEGRQYAYLTLHRPSNVDNYDQLSKICEQIIWLSDKMPIIFLVHPRTRMNFQKSGLEEGLKKINNLHMVAPLGYIESLSLLLSSKVVITDSGGLQEETSALNIPCLTLRENTERPVTVELGTNTLIQNDWNLFRDCIDKILNDEYLQKVKAIPFWDGQTGKRILEICSNAMHN